MATPWRCISTWAIVTAGEPGPITMRTRGIVSVPNPSAATPAGPLTRNTSPMPSLRHTTSTAGSTAPSAPGAGGTTSTIAGTPATVGRHAPAGRRRSGSSPCPTARTARPTRSARASRPRAAPARARTSQSPSRASWLLVERPAVGDGVVEGAVDLVADRGGVDLVGRTRGAGRASASTPSKRARASHTAASPRVADVVDQRADRPAQLGVEDVVEPRRNSASRPALVELRPATHLQHSHGASR